MKNNVDVIREKWADGQVAIGTGITFSDSSIIELLGEAGLDLVFIDLEHGSLSLETAKTHVMVARGAGLAAFIRVASFDPVVIKPVIDLHPAAIVVPSPNTWARELGTPRLSLIRGISLIKRITPAGIVQL